MSLVRGAVRTLTILGGSTVSGSLREAATLGGMGLSDGQVKVLCSASKLTVIAPAALTGTVKAQFSPDAGTSWRDLKIAGALVQIGANEAVVFEPGGFDDLRLLSSAAEGADRAFKVVAQHNLN